MSEPVSFEELLPLFLKLDAKKEGRWLMIFCPAHADGTKTKPGRRSLGLSPRGVLKCFAGCTETGTGFAKVYEALYEKAGMRKPEKGAPAPVIPIKRAAATEPSVVYQYRDADGKLFGEKARWNYPDGTKSFAWRSPGSTKWYGEGVDALDAPLLGAHLISKVPMDEWIFFCEGEKAAQACIDNGLFAVCHGGGASISDFRHSLEVLTGRHVALWPDNDEPGRKFMLRVQRELKGVARSTRWVSVPVKEKGDAYDFFADGNSADDVFKAAWDKPLVEHIASDHIRVTCYTEAGPIAFSFESMEQLSSLELTTWLTVLPLSKGFEDEPVSERINLLSSSAIESLERRLRKHYTLDSVNWMLTINQAISRAMKAFRENDRGIPIGSIEMVGEHLEYILDGILIRGHHTIVFGDGASTKTLNTYAMGICCASGQRFLGRATKRVGVLVVDYETRALTARHRVDRLLSGMGAAPSLISGLNMHYWPAKGMPIVAQQEALRRYIEKYDIGLVIVDSGGMACGSAPEKSSSATSYFNAIERLGDVTVVTICHVSAAGLSMPEPGKYPFGSRYWHYLARDTFYVQASGIGTDTINASFIPRKNNDYPAKPFAIQADFMGGPGGPIVLSEGTYRTPASSSGPADDSAEIANMVYGALLSDGEMKVWEIATSLDLTTERVASSLDKGKGKLFDYSYERGVRVWRAI